MMVDNLQLEPLSVQFCGELMPQVHIDMCSIIDISNPYLTVNQPRLPVPVHLQVTQVDIGDFIRTQFTELNLVRNSKTSCRYAVRTNSTLKKEHG